MNCLTTGKIKIMKKLLYIYLVSLMLLSCTDQGSGKFYKYTIENKSGKNIKISSYRSTYPKRDIPIVMVLNNGQSLTKIFQDNLPPSGYDFAVFFNGDSIVINYENLKFQKYDFYDGKICDQNPLFNSPFCKSGTTVTFTFTLEDYQNAQDCGGNCN